jgi:hypothetical protein
MRKLMRKVIYLCQSNLCIDLNSFFNVNSSWWTQSVGPRFDYIECGNQQKEMIQRMKAIVVNFHKQKALFSFFLMKQRITKSKRIRILSSTKIPSFLNIYIRKTSSTSLMT